MTDLPPPPRLSILYDVHRVSRLVGELVEESLTDHEITGTEFALYSLLVVTGPSRVSEVAAGIAAPVATASKLIDRLEQRGDVEKTENPADGRSTLVTLTDAGRAAHKAAGPDFGVALRRVNTALGSAHDDVSWALSRLDHALREALAGHTVDSVRSAAPRRSVTYEGAPLTASEEVEVRRHIDYLRWRREQA